MLGNVRLPAHALKTCGSICACAAALGLAAAVVGPAMGQESASTRKQAPESPVQSALPLELVGVMIDSAEAARSACLIRCTFPVPRRSASMLQAGETACDLAEIKEIRRDAVILRNLQSDRLETLTLKTTGDSPQLQIADETSVPAPAVVQTSPGQVSVEMPKASVERYLLNLPELLRSAQATPHWVDGVNGQRFIEGFEIAQIRAGSLIEQVGLRNGDVMLEVNGEVLDGLPAVLRLFSQAQAAGQATLTVLRGGQRMTFVFNTK